jgi:pyruvate dehydrogenase E1 component alpha subunit
MTTEQSLRLYQNMFRVRRMEEVCAELYVQEKIRGFLHLYIGEEAVATGVMDQLSTQDNVVATYREHGHALLKGIPAKSIMAEMFGKTGGCSGGRGGSMHLYSWAHRFFGGNAIVASGLPHAAGLAFASQTLKENRLTVCFFGEGAMAEGLAHETLNMASLWRLPVLFCCENNFYAMGTALSRSQAQTDLVKRAASYEISGTSVDGMNIYSVVTRTAEALQYIRSHQRPYFIEFQTYRFRPHSMFDPDLYRQKSEINEWKERDPLVFMQRDLFAKGLLTRDMDQQIKQRVEAELTEAVEFAESSPREPVSDLEKEIYAPLSQEITA